MDQSQCKSGSVFNLEDYNSNDGMLTSVWGPSLWHSLHTISFNYPIRPTQDDKKNYYNFYKNLVHILPCRYCRENYKKNIKTIKLNMSVMKNRFTLSNWLYEIHELVNEMLGKTSNLSYQQVRDRYEMFRSRCLDNKTLKRKKKTKREKGCVKPLYGIKSKCVINIVPKKKKCKTFKIDKKCVLKR